MWMGSLVTNARPNRRLSLLDGKSIKESKLYDPAKPFENRDPRLAYSILWDGQELAGKTYDSNGMGTETLLARANSMRKYVNPKNDGNNEYGWTNFIYIRYADILLTYAEAQNELKGPDKSVYAAINQVPPTPQCRASSPPGWIKQRANA